MATAQASIEDLVTCPICMERMREPKHLHCQHAFCAQCLKDWTNQPGSPKRAIICPVCRGKTPNHKGIGKLPTAIGVTNLLDMLESHEEKEPKFKFACGVDGVQDVVVFCESCRYHLCAGCLDNHLQDQTLWSHLLYITDVPCIKHLSKLQDRYCLYCQQVGCDECMNENHQDHEPAPLAAVAKFNRSAILDLFKPLQAMVANVKEQSEMSSVYALERKFEDLKQQIESHTKKGHKMLDIWKKAVLADLKMKAVKLGNEVSEVQDQLSKADSLVSFMNRFLQEGSDFQLVTAFSATSQKLHKTTDSLSHTERRHRNEDCDLVFLPKPIPESYGSLMLPKDVITCTKASAKAEAPIPAKPLCNSSSQTSVTAKSTCNSSSQTSAAAKSVCTVLSQTTHSGEIQTPPNASGGSQNQTSASACAAPKRAIHSKTMEFDADKWINKDIISSVDLHDKDSPSTERSHKALGFFQWLRGTRDEDLGAYNTVFMCNKTGYLYIGEAGWWTSGNLWRVDSCTDLSQFHRKWGFNKIMTVVSPTSVTVSPVDGTITACVGYRIAAHMFGIIPRESAGLIKHDTISFPTISAPFSMAISDTHWVVLDKKNSLVRISTYSNGEDTHVLTFGSVGSGQRQFIGPSHVCCDSVRDRFIVSDTGNNRIQVFDMLGNYLWEAGESGAVYLEKPWGMCLDGLGNIIVADSGNYRLVVLGWENGEYLTDISTYDIIPHSVTVDGRDDNVAYLVVAGLRGKMPVVETRKLVSPKYQEKHYGYGYRWHLDDY